MVSIAKAHSNDWPEGARKHNRATGISLPATQSDTIGRIIEVWLLDNYAPTSGKGTASIYRNILHSLRVYLQAQGLDLDGPCSQLSQLIQTWACERAPNSKHKGDVAPATYNQRIAAINSFYSWVDKQQIASWPNPTRMLSRSVIQKYADAQALDIQQVNRQLKQIDRSMPRGKRDYVLLQVALNTGQSVSELAQWTWGNVVVHNEQVTLTFERNRRHKAIYDTLDSRLSLALLDYLHTIYGQDLSRLSPASPIWVSFSDRTYLQAIGPQTIADICVTHLGVSKVQRLRHTFALAMDQVGAPRSVIQTKLGHENPSTTTLYLAVLKKAHNPYAAALADTFEVEATAAKRQ